MASIVDYMKSKGMDSSYGNRAKLAAQYGIKGYQGTAGQNISLLGYLQKGPKPSKPPTASVGHGSAINPSSGYKGNSIVDYLKSTGKDSSYGNRSKLAAQYGIKGYTGSASQNTSLLNKLRSGAVGPSKPP
ncbi:MAG TPA: hypothetical protein VFH42_04140, partial [Sporolactobacillaceae bacterium]|nr:hypothetical protein [Sporolactobacillaceae bacterium]